MRLPIILWILIATAAALPANAAGPLADSLSRALSDHPENDTVRVRLLSALAKANYGIAPDLTDSLAGEALELASSLGFTDGMAEAHYYLGVAGYVRSRFDEAAEHGRKSIEYYEASSNRRGLSNAYSLLGGIYTFKAEYDKSLDYHLKALEIRETFASPVEAAKTLMNIGLIYHQQKDFELARQHLVRSLKVVTGRGDIVTEASLFNNLGATYMELDSVDLALSYFQKSLELYEKLGQKIVMTVIVRNIGNIHSDHGDPLEGLPHFRRALRLAGEIGNDYEAAGAGKDFGAAFLRLGAFDSAGVYLDQARSAAARIGAKELELQALDKIVLLHEARGNLPRALSSLREYMTLQNEIRNEERSSQVENLRIRYDTERKEKENEILRARETANLATIQKNNFFFISIGAAGLLLLGLIVMMWISNARIKAQKERLEELNREKDGLTGIVAHDLRTPLTRVEGLIQVLALQGGLNPEQKETIALIRKVTAEGAALIRDLLQVTAAEHEETGLELSQFDLNGFVRDLLVGHSGHAAEKNIALRFDPPGETFIIETDREFLVRILDNLVSNALKFSPPGRNVFILTDRNPGGFRISVRDEGPGISAEDQEKMFRKFQKLSARPTAGESSTGLGLCIVKALTERLGGKLKVESRLGEGAEFTVELE